MNIHIERIGEVSALVYTHKAQKATVWRVYLLSEVPEHQRERALIKQERIASKRNCVVKTVELDRPPWEVDALFGKHERKSV